MTERITRYVRLVIDASGSQSGSREVRRAIEDINSSVKRTVAGLDGLKTAFAAVFAAVGVRELARMADGWNLVAGRLNILEGSTVAAAAAQAELLRVANSARAEFEGVATLYTRIGSVTRELGLSQRDNALATEALALSFRVAGATAAEASSSSIQFTQSLASGVVRGEELNSLLDSNIPLVKIIAREFGVTTGELKRLGEEGLLSTSRILPALIRELDNLRDQASKLPETIGGAFTVLGNNLQAFVGQVDAATGITDFFARAILLLADNLDTAAVFFGTLSTIAIPGVIAGIRSLTALLAANPIGLLITAGAAAAAALYELSTQTVQFGDRSATLGSVLGVVWSDFTSLLSEVGSFASAMFYDFTNWLEKLAQDSGLSWGDFINFAKSAVNGAIALGLSLVDSWSGFFRAIYEAASATFTGIGEGAAAVGRGVSLALSGEFEAAAAAFGSAFEGFDYSGIERIATETAGAIGGNFGRDFIAEAGGVIEPYLASVFDRLGVSVRFSVPAPARVSGDTAEIVAPGGAAKRAADGVRDAAKAAKSEFEAARVAADDFGRAASSAFESIGQRGVDLVTDGLTSGKFAFKDFADFAIKELTRLAVSSVFTQVLGLFGGGLLGGVGGGAGGGLFGSLFGGLFADGAAFRGGSVVPFAKGGVVESPTFFPMARGRTGLMGEAGPEAIMPLHRLPSGGLGVAAAGGGGQVIHVNYVSNIHARGADKEGLAEVKQQIAQDRATFKLRVVEAVQEGSKKRMLK